MEAELLGRETQEAEAEYAAELAERRNRFRILVCIDGSDEAYEGLQFAADLGKREECDIILLSVRPFDQGLQTGGMQLSVTRENMLEWGFEVPHIQHLRKGLDLLVEAGHMPEVWDARSTHAAVKGDPLGDSKVEYKNAQGKLVVLKLKTAHDAVSGVLDQYELGPYNLIITGPPTRWLGDLRSFWDAGVTQKVAMLAPSSTLVARPSRTGAGFLICVDGSGHALDAAFRAGVLAQANGFPITLLSVAKRGESPLKARRQVKGARIALRSRGLEVTRLMIRSGDPTEEIIKAGEAFDLIVVSDSGKSRLKRFFVGSVAFNVMGYAKTSVLNVR